MDLTLEDERGLEVPMGGAIDDIAAHSWPDHWASATTPEAIKWHANRQLLNDIMSIAGFCRLAHEWWHFSLGDQYWAWAQQEADPTGAYTARYGRADLL